jgi:cholesterol oxidase
VTHSVRSLRRAWPDLRPLAPEDVIGDLEASFVAPLRAVAPRGLGLIGLRHWYGKRFRGDGASVAGVNLVRRDGTLVETLPMAVRSGTSLGDGRPALVVSYPTGSPRPWPWVRDELRAMPDGTVVGMTVVDLPVLRRLPGTPFLLTRRTAE